MKTTPESLHDFIAAAALASADDARAARAALTAHAAHLKAGDDK